MSTLSEAGQARQAQLTRKFLDSLPEKMAQIADCWNRIESSDWSVEEVDRLRMQSHRLTGSAGCFGLDDLGEATARLDSALRAGVNSSEQRRIIAQRVAVLIDLLKTSGSAKS